MSLGCTKVISQPPLQVPPALKGIYFGSYDDTMGVRTPLLVYLDTKTHRGSGLREELEDVKLNEGKITFRTDGSLGASYRFSGELEGDTITGWITDTNRPAKPVTLVPISITKRDLQQGIGVIFDNVNYIEEAGDVAGAEVVILPVAGALMPLLTLAEGVYEGPYTPKNVRVNNGVMTFQTALESYTYPERTLEVSSMFWNVTFSATKATLVQLDSNGQHFGEEPQSHEELPRRETLEHYLTRIANRGSHVK